MANNFKPWVDDANISGNVQSRNEFSNDAQRKSGFQANQPASAVRINTALRQANLVSAALMEFVDSVKSLPSTLDVQSSVTQVKNAFKNAADELESIAVGKAKLYTDARELVLDGKIDAVDLKADGIQGELNTAKSNITSLGTNKVDKVSGMGLSTKDYSVADQTKVSKIITNGDGTKHLSNDGTYKTVANATNVTTNINGKAISSIFESNGTTVKNATTANTAKYTESNQVKTIETRLIELGFKPGAVSVQNSSYYSSSNFMQQGRVIIGTLSLIAPARNIGSTAGQSGSDGPTNVGIINTEGTVGKKLILTISQSRTSGYSTNNYTCNFYLTGSQISCERSWSAAHQVDGNFVAKTETALLAYCPKENKYWFSKI